MCFLIFEVWNFSGTKELEPRFKKMIIKWVFEDKLFWRKKKYCNLGFTWHSTEKYSTCLLSVQCCRVGFNIFYGILLKFLERKWEMCIFRSGRLRRLPEKGFFCTNKEFVRNLMEYFWRAGFFSLLANQSKELLS